MSIRKSFLCMVVVLLLPMTTFAATKVAPNPYHNNPLKAFNYVYSIAVKQNKNDKWAEYLLGSYYEQGAGTSKDVTKAYVWYKMSAGNKYEPAISALAKLKGTLNASQIQQGEDAYEKANTTMVSGEMQYLKNALGR